MTSASAPAARHRLRGRFQIGAVPRNQDQRGKVTRKADGGGPADALAGSRDNGDRLRHPRSPSGRRMASAGKEVADGRRDLGGVGLQREMAGVEEADDGVGNVALERLRARRQEERIVLAPDGEERRLVGPEIVLEGRVERDVALIVAEQVELQVGDAWPGQVEVVERVPVRRDRPPDRARHACIARSSSRA